MREPRTPGGAARAGRRSAVREVPAATTDITFAYAPDIDGRADAGEVVWAWVPYEDDPAQGKDRPLLVVGARDGVLHALMLSSRTPDPWEERDWTALGAGPWDRGGRPSYVALDRLFELPEDGIRREGAVLGADRFRRVCTALLRRHGRA
jgi:hypothetical protein